MAAEEKVLNEEHHKTIILITHDMDGGGEIAKRVIVLEQGKIVIIAGFQGVNEKGDIIK